MIDFHTHIFPENLADRAIKTITETSGNILTFSAGEKEDLIKWIMGF